MMETFPSENEHPCTTTFYEELRPIVNKHINSIDDLAKKTGISDTTLWRWSNSVNVKLPDPNKVLDLLCFDSKKNSLLDIANHYSGAIAQFLRDSFPEQMSKRSLINNECHTIKDQYDFCIYYICGTERGASEDELITILGQIAIKKAEIPEHQVTAALVKSFGEFAKNKIANLVAANVIAKSESGNYTRVIKNTYIKVQDGLEKGLQLLTDFIKPSEWGQGKNIFYMFQESVPPQVAEEITQTLNDAYLACKEKAEKNKSNAQDAVPYVFSVIGERLWFDSERIGQTEEIIQ
ncbi:MAG: hypothetical protein A2X86_19750 [Bdellovibrionales bacterium GWA2_49_15]|nr:MAG: hypothetical protein A2X86_19750 [Bdellovibrionales bacterium GWA2_49_15]HAZ12494.1 hypothetical protein [Bdellovibrionales bacterium]